MCYDKIRVVLKRKQNVQETGMLLNSAEGKIRYII